MYIQKDANGNIVNMTQLPQIANGADWTEVADDAAEVTAFLNPPQTLNGAIAKTYADVDAIYAAAVGNRGTEYQEAEQAALAYQAAGYSGTVSGYIAGYATSTGITNQQSADMIVMRANALRAAVLAMRNNRFTSQAAMRAAKTQAELDTAVAAWDAFVSSTKAALGL